MPTDSVTPVNNPLGDLPPASEWTLRFDTDFGPDDHEASFAAYQTLYRDFKVQFPYHLDLDKMEFVAALNHEHVGKAVIEVRSRRLALPLFGPVSADPWLSDGYYRRIERSQSVSILHFFHLPGFILHGEVLPSGLLAHLAALAGSNILWSYAEPSPNHAAGNQLRDIARTAGLRPDTPQRLGSEIFFAGKLEFKHGHSGAASQGLIDVYNAIVADGHTIGDADNVVSVKTVMDHAEMKSWWPVYRRSFGRIEKDHPCRQKLDSEAFVYVMRHPDVFKVLAYDRTGTPVAMCLLGDVMALSGEMNAAYFRRHFPVESEARQMMCFRGLFSHTTKQKQRRTRHLIRLLTDMGERAGGDWIITFSTRDQTRRVIPYLTQRAITGTQKAELPLYEIGSLGFDVFQVR